MHWTTLRPSLLAGLAGLIVALTIAACGGSSGNQPTITPAGAGGASTPGVGQSSTAVKSGTPASSSSTTSSTTPGISATGGPGVTISPSDVTMGNTVFTFSVQPAGPILDPAKSAPTPTGGSEQSSTTPLGTYVVLGGSALNVTNNLDPSQSAPADQPQEMLRHVSVQIKDKSSAQLIPSLVVTMDLLREGRPVLQDQPLVPMVPSGGGVAQMSYGNNVKFPGTGQYQVFVRLEASPLLGAGGSGVAQFNVSLNVGQ